MNQGDVFVLQPLHVSHNLRLGLVSVEDGMGQELSGALKGRVGQVAVQVGRAWRGLSNLMKEWQSKDQNFYSVKIQH